MLSCSCGEWDGEGVGYNMPNDFTTLKTSKRKRCCSCKQLIEKDSVCLEFDRFRYPNTEIEIKILGDDYEICMASWYMCEQCGEIYLNLSEIGYCLEIETPMQEYLKIYHEMTGFKK